MSETVADKIRASLTEVPSTTTTLGAQEPTAVTLLTPKQARHVLRSQIPGRHRHNRACCLLSVWWRNPKALQVQDDGLHGFICASWTNFLKLPQHFRNRVAL